MTATKAGGGMVAVFPFAKLQDAIETEGQLVFPIMQMLGQNAMAHSRGEAVEGDKNIYGRAKSAKREGHMEVFYRNPNPKPKPKPKLNPNP